MAGLFNVSGLASGLDWKNVIDQLRSVEHKPIDLVNQRKTDNEGKLKAWQDLNTRLLSFRTAVEKLRLPDSFNLFNTALSSSSSTSATEILSTSIGTGADMGSYAVEVLQTARGQKISSKGFSSLNESLGLSGTALIKGRALNLEASDTLVDIRNKINNLNSGTSATKVSASIISTSATDYRLVLTSQTEGAAGLSLQQVGSADIFQDLGLIASTDTIKNATINGARSDAFSSAGVAVSSLLGLSGPLTGTATIGGIAVAIDLGKNLNDLADDINNTPGIGATARVVSIIENGATSYRLEISGTTSFIDSGNVLQTLGVLKGIFGSLQEIHVSDRGNNKISGGGGAITAATTWGDIDTGSGINNIANNDTITITGTRHDGTTVAASYQILDKNTDLVQGLLTAIESAFGSGGNAVTASFDANGRIVVTDNVPGDSALTISLITNNQGGGSLNLGTITASQQGYAMELQSGRDARLRVDGNYLTRTSNTISDAIAGITLNLKKAEEGTTVTLNVNRDLSGLATLVKEMADTYNGVMSFVQSQSSYDIKKKETGGVLFGDGTLNSIKADLVKNLVGQIWGVNSQFSTLGLAGVNVDAEGKLSVNETLLQGYLENNFEDIKQLFTAHGTTSTGTLSYLNYGLDTKPGTYNVNVTQAAERASVTGTTDLSGGLVGGGDVLNLTVGGASVAVTLTAGMSLTEIIDAINEEMDTTNARSVVGEEVLYADAGMNNAISGSTTWANVFDDTGASAGLLNGDAIHFSGQTRTGKAVSGSYTITDIGLNTVQGLLSAIETAYGNTVTAQINSEGKIALTDKTDGTSSINLTVNTVRNLNFGMVDIDPTGADGSREGRYALAVSASASADNRYLVLSQDSYGSAQTFTVTQSTDRILGAGLNGSYAGMDVVGTINGEAATGKGQVLTGNKGDDNVDSLVLKYTGAATGSVGTVTFTTGAAEGFYRSLISITDKFDGYLSFKQTSLQESIARFGTQVSEMETRLDRKMEMLTNRFVAMEKALSQMQSMSSWLSAQITAMNSQQ